MGLLIKSQSLSKILESLNYWSATVQTLRCSCWQPIDRFHFVITWEDSGWEESHINNWGEWSPPPQDRGGANGRRGSTYEATHQVKLWRGGKMHLSPSLSSAYNPKACNRDTLVGFFEVPILQCLVKWQSCSKIVWKKKEKECLWWPLLMGVSYSALLHNREGWLAVVESELSGACWILFELVGVCCCRNACIWQDRSEKMNYLNFPINGVELKILL